MKNEKLEEVLNGILEKFKKAEMFQSINDEDSAMEVINTISDEEIKIVKSVGKRLMEVSNILFEIKKEYSQKNG